MTRDTLATIEHAASHWLATGDSSAFYDTLLELRQNGKKWTYAEVSDITGITPGVLRIELDERKATR